uniref:RNA guanine-7 methyltransferase activating subunit n=1 Tax=Leptobrachium leishanense TaxID=445787 RepID=A0A8C5MVP3_9ANUR
MAETTDPQMFEEMFANRFTASDEEYQAYVKSTQDQPPIVENWRAGNQRPQDRYRDRQNRGWEGRRDWSSSYNQPRGGGRSWGNHYNEHRQEGRYGYNPGNQKFYSDRY